ncbi:hypothetical protein [Tenacibaculum xiamenense]|uniref:hypothetical protein n=1 Tax=Tenacibaculum xiamenense TaxID=1261553 RepID=UPI003895C8B5
MKLEDFISESIIQIINGVEKAQRFALEKKAKVNPKSLILLKASENSYVDEYSNKPAQSIDFDISITTKEEGGTSGKLGVFVSVFKAGVEGREAIENFTSNKIKFSVPIVLPYQEKE